MNKIEIGFCIYFGAAIAYGAFSLGRMRGASAVFDDLEKESTYAYRVCEQSVIKKADGGTSYLYKFCPSSSETKEPAKLGIPGNKSGTLEDRTGDAP